MADAHSPSDAPQRLTAIRGEIDSVDQELLALFNRRAALSLEVGRIKAGDPGIVFKPLREREVLDGLARKNDGPLPEEHLRAIWREIFSSSRALQRPQNVAYLGPEGTFSYFAGVEYLGHAASFHPCNDLPQVFADVHSGRCELGVVPLENSLQGTVGVSFDLFLKYDVHIQAELFSPISHCLLSHAASLADVRDNIVDFKDGYETVLGERGVTVSGGQKQRISIARALLKDAPILILDDSVSAVDTRTEKIILDNLKASRAGKTTLLIAHRISTVERLDKIIFLNEGRVEAVGPHDQLYASCPEYRRMVDLQRLEDETKGGENA